MSTLALFGPGLYVYIQKVLFYYYFHIAMDEKKSLRLIGQGLEVFPPEVFDDEIQVVDLSFNSLSVPNSLLASMRRLEMLLLPRNKFAQWTLGEMDTLTFLDLSGNNITALPAQLRMPKLTFLDLSVNKLTLLPESVGDLQALQVLLLDRNDLTILPGSVGRLKALDRLNVSHNKVSCVCLC